MKKQANKTASSGSSDKDSSAESSAPEEGEQSSTPSRHGHAASVLSPCLSASPGREPSEHPHEARTVLAVWVVGSMGP